jgi:hypothetical protein
VGVKAQQVDAELTLALLSFDAPADALWVLPLRRAG